MNEQYMRLRKEWHEANERANRAKRAYDDLLKQANKAFDIRNDFIDEVADCEEFLEHLNERRPPAVMVDSLSHFNKVALIVKARAYDRLVDIAKGSSNFDAALYHARHHPKYLDED